MTHEDAHYLLRLIAEQDERNQQIRTVLVNFLMRQDEAARVLAFPAQLRAEPSRYPCPDAPDGAA